MRGGLDDTFRPLLARLENGEEDDEVRMWSKVKKKKVGGILRPPMAFSGDTLFKDERPSRVAKRERRSLALSSA